MFTRRVYTKAKLLFLLMTLFLLSIPASAQTDNCCGIDRECSTDDEWTTGYYAFRNGECSAASDSQQQSQEQSSSQSNNCCFSGWECDSDDDWTSGYFAFQNDQCDAQSAQSSNSNGVTSSNSGGSNPVQPRRNSNSVQPQQTNNPVQPQQTNNPAQPQQTNNPAQPQQTNNPAQPQQTNNPVQPQQTNNPVQPQQNDNQQQQDNQDSVAIELDGPTDEEREYESNNGNSVTVRYLSPEEFWGVVCRYETWHAECSSL